MITRKSSRKKVEVKFTMFRTESPRALTVLDKNADAMPRVSAKTQRRANIMSQNAERGKINAKAESDNNIPYVS